MQIRKFGKNAMIRADRGKYLVRKDGEKISVMNPNYPEDYKITSLMVAIEDIQMYDEKELYEEIYETEEDE